jgi:putative zinc finger/helix-turn-helix YgiT family protein
VLSDREDFEMSTMRNDGHDETVVCFDCGSSDVAKALQQQTFQYGNGESAVNLTAEMPVYTCKTCGYQFAGPEADDARHEAVCRYLGVLTPAEISAVRESTGLSRIQFAECTGVGIASLKRWETGILIQNAANDQLIYLMTFPDNIIRLKRRDHFALLDLSDLSSGSEIASRHVHSNHFRGKCIQPDSLQLRRAQRFVL